eukprot:COSAG02_NODE_319_length_24795_cov_20.998502_17_plen_74_part_00
MHDGSRPVLSCFIGKLYSNLLSMSSVALNLPFLGARLVHSLLELADATVSYFVNPSPSIVILLTRPSSDSARP